MSCIVNLNSSLYFDSFLSTSSSLLQYMEKSRSSNKNILKFFLSILV